MKKCLFLLFFIKLLYSDIELINTSSDKSSFFYVYSSQSNSSFLSAPSGGECVKLPYGGLVTIFVKENLEKFYNLNNCMDIVQKNSNTSQSLKHIKGCPFTCDTTIIDGEIIDGQTLNVTPVCKNIANYILNNFQKEDMYVWQIVERVDCSSSNATGYCGLKFFPKNNSTIAIDSNKLSGNASNLPTCSNSTTCTFFNEKNNSTSTGKLKALGSNTLETDLTNWLKNTGGYGNPPNVVLSFNSSSSFNSAGLNLLEDYNLTHVSKEVNNAINSYLSNYTWYPEYAPTGLKAKQLSYWNNQIDSSNFNELINESDSQSPGTFLNNLNANINNKGGSIKELLNKSSSIFMQYLKNYICLNTNFLQSHNQFYDNSLLSGAGYVLYGLSPASFFDLIYTLYSPSGMNLCKIDNNNVKNSDIQELIVDYSSLYKNLANSLVEDDLNSSESNSTFAKLNEYINNFIKYSDYKLKYSNIKPISLKDFKKTLEKKSSNLEDIINNFISLAYHLYEGCPNCSSENKNLISNMIGSLSNINSDKTRVCLKSDGLCLKSKKHLKTIADSNFKEKYSDPSQTPWFVNNCCLTYHLIVKAAEQKINPQYIKQYKELKKDTSLPCIGESIQLPNGDIFITYTCSTLNVFKPSYVCSFIYQSNQNNPNATLIQSFCRYSPTFAIKNNGSCSGKCNSLKDQNIKYSSLNNFNNVGDFGNVTSSQNVACKDGIYNFNP